MNRWVRAGLVVVLCGVATAVPTGLLLGLGALLLHRLLGG